MTTRTRLSDADHPAIQETAKRLTDDARTPLDAAEALFTFVRDDIVFGFPPTWDDVTASETLAAGRGYCTTKATLLHALAMAAGIETRLHTGLMGKQVLHGVVPAPLYAMLRPVASHTWTELRVGDEWMPLDSYIVDEPLYRRVAARLEDSDRDTGWLLSRADGPPSSAFNFGERGFNQMGAVQEDHGVWDDFADYMATDAYVGMPRWQQPTWPLLSRYVNRRLARLRRS